jgi:hypothetical protein
MGLLKTVLARRWPPPWSGTARRGLRRYPAALLTHPGLQESNCCAQHASPEKLHVARGLRHTASCVVCVAKWHAARCKAEHASAQSATLRMHGKPHTRRPTRAPGAASRASRALAACSPCVRTEHALPAPGRGCPCRCGQPVESLGRSSEVYWHLRGCERIPAYYKARTWRQPPPT